MSIARKPRNHDHFWCGALCGAPTVCGSSWNSSSIVDAARIDRACGLSACSTSSGTITVRAQYEILSMWNGNHFGSSMISTGITGTLFHGITP